MELFGFLKAKSRPVLGLDITSSSVKLIELSRSGNKYRAESYMVRPLPPNTVVEKNINDVEALADTIRKLVAQAKPQSRRSEEHTSELQSRENVVCGGLLEKP